MPKNTRADFQILYVGEDGKSYDRVPLHVNKLIVNERKTQKTMEISFEGMPEQIMCAFAAAGMVRFMTMSLRNKRTPEGDKVLENAKAIEAQYRSGRLYIRDGSATARARAIPPLDKDYYKPLFESWLLIKESTKSQPARARGELVDKLITKMETMTPRKREQYIRKMAKDDASFEYAQRKHDSKLTGTKLPSLEELLAE